MVCKSFIRSGMPGLAVASLETAVRHDPNDREARDLLKLARAGRDEALAGDKESWVIIAHVEKISVLKLVEARFFVDGRRADKLAVPAGAHTIEAQLSYRGVDANLWKGAEILLKGSHLVTVPKDSWLYIDITTHDDSSTGFWRFTMDFSAVKVPIEHESNDGGADTGSTDA